MLVSCEWLKEQLDKGLPDNVVICDVSWSHLPEINKRLQYKREHIPGAVYINVYDEKRFTDIFIRQIPEKEYFEKIVREAGVNAGDHVIIYSDSKANGYIMSGRAWWTFRLFGHTKVSILDGGLKRWKKIGGDTVNELPKIMTGNFMATFTPNFIKLFEEVKEKVKSSSVQLCDSRPAHLYAEGHIKGSVNIPLETLMTKEGTLQSVDGIKKVFQRAGVDLRKPLIAHCVAGVTSCTLVFSGVICGCPDPSLYLGSFCEWNKRADDELKEKSAEENKT